MSAEQPTPKPSDQPGRFHLGDILSVTTGYLVSPRHMDGIYDVLNWMTGDNLFTHQLPRASDECQPHLLAQHPDLASVDVPDFDGVSRDDVKAAVEVWLSEQVALFGEYRDVAPLADEDHTTINPLVELAMNHPHLEVTPIVVPEAGGES
jgi:hypothetical protein